MKPIQSLPQEKPKLVKSEVEPYNPMKDAHDYFLEGLKYAYRYPISQQTYHIFVCGDWDYYRNVEQEIKQLSELASKYKGKIDKEL